jgi:hypothetical protein
MHHPLLQSLRVAVAQSIGSRWAGRRVRRLERATHDISAQWNQFRKLSRWLAASAYACDVGIESGIGYERYRYRVQPIPYEGFVPYIERMKRGETDVLHPGRCSYFAVSSGTTAGASKWLPVNAPMLAHFRAAGLDSLALFASQTNRSSIFSGRQLFLGGSTGLVPMPDSERMAHAGDLSGITALNLPWWVQRYLYEPGPAIAQMAHWPDKLTAIAERTWDKDITLVAGIPSWLLLLAQAVREAHHRRTGRLAANLREIWPNLQCLVHGGVPVGPFSHELSSAFGRGVTKHEVYPASEGFIAVQDHHDESGLRLLTDRGIFFEFIPLATYDENDAARNAAQAVPLEAVQAGVDYVLLLTTPAGLVRYVIGDLVRFLSVSPPRLIYVGRIKLQLSAFGEHVIEKELTDALTAACDAMNLSVADFHVAPCFPLLGEQNTGRHEWWIELRQGCRLSAPDNATLATTLDHLLCNLNDDYAGKRQGGGLRQPVIRIVTNGTFEKWLRQKGKWGGQNKTPRCRSDRKVACELAELMCMA